MGEWRELKKTPLNRRIFARDSDDELPAPEPGRPWSPYWNAGSHPDCVEHVWDKLGGTLPEDCRFVALGRPVLAHPATGFVFAMPYGTEYALWVPEAERPNAAAAGMTPTQKWSTGEATNLEDELGSGWLFGNYAPEEANWVAAAYRVAATRSS